MSAQKNASVAKVRVAGNDYAAIDERSCFTCSSPYREHVEEQLLGGRTYARIVADLPDDAHLSSRNVADHWKNGHLPINEPTVRAVLEERAEERGESLRPALEAVVEHVDFARRLLSRVRERVADGEIEPDIRDGLKAAEIIAKYDSAEPVGDDLYVEAFSIYFDTAKQLMTEDQFDQFGDELANNSLLVELMQESERRHAEASLNR